MTGTIKATPPNVWPGPARFGLNKDQWKRVMNLAWEYEQVGCLREFPGCESVPQPEPSNRLLFARWLRVNGVISEDVKGYEDE